MQKAPAHPIEWHFPLPRTHAGIAMGNGLLGALVWGTESINITLNRSDFWDHRNDFRPTEGVSTYANMVAKYRPGSDSWFPKVFPVKPRTSAIKPPSRLPFGRFELELYPGCRPVSGSLDYATGKVTIRVAKRGNKTFSAITFDLSVKLSVILVRDPGRIIRDVRIRTAWEWVRERLQLTGFPEPVQVSRPGLRGWAQECPADPALAAICRRSREGFIIALERGSNATAAIKAADKLAARALSGGTQSICKANATWWQAYWKRAPEVKVPDKFMSKFYLYALYKFGAATNPNCRWPAGLQGPWVEEYQPTPWGGDYHFNVNVQQAYSPAFQANQLEHLMPLFDMIDSWKGVMRRYARTVCGINDGFIIGMCCDDRNRLLGLGPGVLIDHACSGWIAQMFWQYYLYTGDVKFLRKRAYPFMLGVMRVYEAMLEEKNGRLSLAIGISAEFGNDIYPRIMGKNPSWQLACIHMLAAALQEAARVLKIPPRPAWAGIRKKTPLYSLCGKPGEERIAVWENQDLDHCHRHHSHLACIYPFDSLGAPTPEKERIVENSIDHWINMGMGRWSEWCMPWAAIIQARMGFKESPWLIMQVWRKLFINEGLATVYLPKFRGITAHRCADQKKPREANEVMQIDGTMGAVTALYEMLVHTRTGVTRVFPAVPEEWRDVSFEGVRLPGGFFMSASRKNCRTEFIAVKSLRGGALTLGVEDCPVLSLKRRRGGPALLPVPARVSFAPGETVVLRPA
ncbi:MAG: hypothetical protein WC299_01535 [Kiritimatiellia bacterium]